MITEEVTCVDAAKVVKCFEKWGKAESMAPCPQEIQGEKKALSVFFWFKSGGSDTSGIMYGITAETEA